MCRKIGFFLVVVNPVFYQHICSNFNLLSNFKRTPTIEACVYFNDVIRLWGVGSISIFVDNKEKIIGNVYYTPALKKNMFSQRKLFEQGYYVEIEGSICHIKEFADGIGESSEDGHSSKESSDAENGENYLNNYFSCFAISDEEEDCYEEDYEEIKEMDKERTRKMMEMLKRECGNKAFTSQTKIESTGDVLSLLDILQIYKGVLLHREKFLIVFEEIVKWFYEEYVQTARKKLYPPTTKDGMQVELFELYMCVEVRGGYEKVTKESSWAAVAEDMGLERNKGQEIRVIYIQYLEVIKWYYKDLTKREVLKDESCEEEDECCKECNKNGGWIVVTPQNAKEKESLLKIEDNKEDDCSGATGQDEEAQPEGNDDHIITLDE